MDLDSAVEELYGLDPASFTSRRDTISAGVRKSDRELASAVKALRRPSAAAHAVNLLARSCPEELAQLVALGERLRVAQDSLSADDLRALGKQRSQLVAQMARRAAALVGTAPSQAAVREIESTLEAAMGDPAASAAVQSGHLVRALERTGLDGVDLEGALAGGPVLRTRDKSRISGGIDHTSAAAEEIDAGAAEEALAGTRAKTVAAAGAAEEARAGARAAREAAAERHRSVAEAAAAARHALTGATAARDQADARVDQLSRELAEARRVADDAAEQQRLARRRAADSAADAEEASRALERAETKLRDLED